MRPCEAALMCSRVTTFDYKCASVRQPWCTCTYDSRDLCDPWRPLERSVRCWSWTCSGHPRTKRSMETRTGAHRTRPRLAGCRSETGAIRENPGRSRPSNVRVLQRNQIEHFKHNNNNNNNNNNNTQLFYMSWSPKIQRHGYNFQSKQKNLMESTIKQKSFQSLLENIETVREIKFSR